MTSEDEMLRAVKKGKVNDICLGLEVGHRRAGGGQGLPLNVTLLSALRSQSTSASSCHAHLDPVFHPRASSIKVNFSNLLSTRVMPNCICKAKSEKGRTFVGDQIDECIDLSSLFYILPPFPEGSTRRPSGTTSLASRASMWNPSPQDLIFTEP